MYANDVVCSISALHTISQYSDFEWFHFIQRRHLRKTKRGMIVSYLIWPLNQKGKRSKRQQNNSSQRLFSVGYVCDFRWFSTRDSTNCSQTPRQRSIRSRFSARNRNAIKINCTTKIHIILIPDDTIEGRHFWTSLTATFSMAKQFYVCNSILLLLLLLCVCLDGFVPFYPHKNFTFILSVDMSVECKRKISRRRR